MRHHTAHHTDQRNAIVAEENALFIQAARRNLTLLRAMYTTRGARYRRLLRMYRDVADTLGCRREVERLAHVLERQPWKGSWRWRPRRRRDPSIRYFLTWRR